MSMRKIIFALMVCLAPLAARSENVSERARQGAMRSIAANSPRPLADAVRSLEQRHGVVITYEDPPYEHDSQVRDVTSEIRKVPLKQGDPRTYIPRGGSFGFQYGLANGRPLIGQLSAVLAGALEQFRATGYAGAFRLERTEDALHVIPTSVRRANGADEPYEAVLSTEVQLFPGERTRDEAVNAILEAVSAATGVNLHQGTVPMNYLHGTKITVPQLWMGSARSLLERVLGPGMSWQLFYGPRDARGPNFALNIHRVASGTER